MVRTLFIILFLTSCLHVKAQDTIPDKKDKWADYEHKPKRSVLWSLFPGAGQIYNEVGYRRVSNKKHRAWWKVPIIYGGLGVCGYYFWHNYSNARLIKQEVLYRRENGPSSNLHPSLLKFSSEDSLINGYSEFVDDELVTTPGFNLHAKRRDIFIAATIGIYALNLIEAYVDGHFVSFDVSQDLTMRFSPVMYDRNSIGLGMQLNFN